MYAGICVDMQPSSLYTYTGTCGKCGRHGRSISIETALETTLKCRRPSTDPENLLVLSICESHQQWTTKSLLYKTYWKEFYFSLTGNA